MGWETAKMDMEQHLLYHKALIDDSVAYEKIERYMKILEEDMGETMPDPIDESIRSVFRMVLEHDFDPWSIDLSEFVRLYSSKITKGHVDLIIAGKLMKMAWKVLRMQSDVTLAESERGEVETVDFGYDFDPELFAEETEGMHIPQVLLREAIYRSPTRPVTMIELMDVWEEAHEDYELFQQREAARAEWKAKEVPAKFNNKAHEEDDEKVVERIWSRIEKMGTGPLTLSDLYTTDIKENITIFVSALHLVRNGRLAIWQDDMPRGEIYIEIKMDWMNGRIEDDNQQMMSGVL